MSTELLTRVKASLDILEALTEELNINAPGSNVKGFRYNPKLKKWQVKYKKGKMDEFSTFGELYEFFSTEGMD